MEYKVLSIKTKGLFNELKDYGIKDVLKNIIDDKQTDEDLKNTAKYYMYWLEKSDTIEDPDISIYNDYNEDQLGKI